MTKGSTIFLAALGGAALAAVLANYLTTERGRQLLQSAGETLKDLSGQAKEYARNNIGEVLEQTKTAVGDVVKEKISQSMQK